MRKTSTIPHLWQHLYLHQQGEGDNGVVGECDAPEVRDGGVIGVTLPRLDKHAAILRLSTALMTHHPHHLHHNNINHNRVWLMLSRGGNAMSTHLLTFHFKINQQVYSLNWDVLPLQIFLIFSWHFLM